MHVHGRSAHGSVGALTAGQPQGGTIVGQFVALSPGQYASAQSFPFSRRFKVYAPGVAASAKWVLVVDDDEDNRDAVVEVLQDAGYTASAAPGGAAALRMMGGTAPALVLTDLSMRGMDGHELLIRTRQLLGTSTPPFVFLTGVPRELADVAETVVTKPCDLEELLGVVGRHCRV